MKDITDIKTLIFDCDGVILDSNKIKSQAFYDVALPYGEEAARAFVEYHIVNGGVSRYRKISYFLEKIVPDVSGPSIDVMLNEYANQVRQGLLTCKVAEGLRELRERTLDARWLIVSGGDQSELREVFAERGLSEFFDGGVFGSPNTKDEILAKELGKGNIQHPALFLGDSKYDYKAAAAAGLNFVFLHAWTEVSEWEEWCLANKINSIEKLSDLLLSTRVR